MDFSSMGMNATLLEKYGERRATVRSACITIVTCYKYAPFFAPKMALLKTTFFTKYLDLRGPKLMACASFEQQNGTVLKKVM